MHFNSTLRRFARAIIVPGMIVLVVASLARAQEPKPANWMVRMNEVSALLTKLAPFLYDDSAFSKPENKVTIEELTGQLAGLSHDLGKKASAKNSSQAPDADPALAFLASEFDDSVTRAHKSFKEGHVEYAQSLLRTTISYCISCHTRAPTHSNQTAMNFGDVFKSAKPIERIRFYAATRQFDRVAQEFDAVYSKGQTASALELESAARVALSVAIRVQRDLTKAEEIATRVNTYPTAPDTLKADAAVWLKELKLWKADTAPAPKQNDARLAAARELIIRAQILQTYPSDAAGDVAYLKASSLLHEVLKEKSSSAERADALFYAGVTYDALRDLGFWSLHESYYEACIRTHPRSPRAQACYSRLKDSLIAGYTGSRGTDIPSDVQKRLTTLEQLANEKKPAKSAK